MGRLLAAVLIGALIADTARATDAEDILNAADFRGGVIVHLGCDDPALLCELGVGEDRIVQGLDTSARARQ